jgi:hypothetical protein
MSKCFISYSWDSTNHKNWVKNLAATLKEDGIEIVLDQWNLVPGDQIPYFMEKSISNNDFVLIICTPEYKRKSDNRVGGVGYEGNIITSELFKKQKQRKFIPILREGTWSNSLPIWLQGRLGIDFTSTPYDQNEYNNLISTLRNTKEKISSIVNDIPLIHNDASFEEIKIVGILVDEVTLPKNDGTPGSALYAIPFKLNRRPSSLWIHAFLKKWDYPSNFTSMHRPGIARVVSDKIILDGTTIDEVKAYHRKTLLLAIKETNQTVKKYQESERIKQQKKQIEIESHKNHVSSIADDIKFD